ncbi:glycosyltransferase family 4 protein [Lysinibacter cavernae]|nr:glycosyltransferase family 4 protein [Lysinibacter cavernae]
MRGFPQYLVSRGWDVHLVSSPGSQLDALRGLDGITVHPLEMAREPSLAADLRGLFAWRSLIQEVRPDVVSAGTPKAGLLGMLAAASLRQPRRIYTLRGLRLEGTSGAKRLILSAVERLTMWASTDIIAVSPSLRSAVLERGLTRAAKIRVLGRGSSNGVDTERFRPDLLDAERRDALRQELGLDGSTPVIGFVGRLNAGKGLEFFAEACQLLVAQGHRFQVLVVGGIDDEASRDIAASFPRDSFSPTGTGPVFTGQVSDTAPYYQVMDILCLPTLREGFPNVVLEAGASGLPVVTTNATGAVDSVVDGETGLIADVASSESLAQKLGQLLEDQAACRALGLAATHQVSKHYSNALVWSILQDSFENGTEGN